MGPSGPCVVDGDCDDGVFCNGLELCRPESTSSDERGCVPTGSPCEALQTCDEELDSCTTDCAIETDADGDGVEAVECGGTDCDDGDARRYPGNTEVCDATGLDEDCDPTTFADPNDADGDGFAALECCNVQTDGELRCGTDCNDGPLGGEVNPAATEVCNGEDEDCDGTIDEGVSGGVFYPDCDGDRFGRSEGMVTGPGGCTPPGTEPAVCPDGSAALWAPNSRDCDDLDPTVNPGATEVCNGKDDDCDGELADDEDNDGDGVALLSCGGTDCDDGDPDVGGCALSGGSTFTWVVAHGYPSGVNGSDPVAGFDLDGRVSTATDAAGCNQADYVSPWGEAGVDNQLGRDEIMAEGAELMDVFLLGLAEGTAILVQLSEVDGCDDDEVTLSILEGRIDPGGGRPSAGVAVSPVGGPAASFAVRLEDGLLVSDDAPYRFPGLSFGGDAVERGRLRGACVRNEEIRRLVVGGFRSTESLQDQGMMPEILMMLADGAVPGFGCEDHLSEAWTLELVRAEVGDAACVFADCDGDGFGTFDVSSPGCSPAEGPAICPDRGWVSTVGDCDDTNPFVFPRAPELCDGRDTNCDGRPASEWMMRDDDGDGVDAFGCGGDDCYPGDGSRTTCGVGEICTLVEPMTFPECRSESDTCWFADCDGDGWGQFLGPSPPPCGSTPSSAPAVCPGGSWADRDGDCYDGNPAVNPGATEVCNGIDDDCDGAFSPYWAARDADGDGASSFACGGADCFLSDDTRIVCPSGQTCSDNGDGTVMCVSL